MNQYRDFAFVYDKLMDDVDYEGWINYIEQIIKNENAQVKNISLKFSYYNSES